MVLVPGEVAERIHLAIAAVDPSGHTIHQEARRYGGIALMGTIGCIWLLRPDGSLWHELQCGREERAVRRRSAIRGSTRIDAENASGLIHVVGRDIPNTPQPGPAVPSPWRNNAKESWMC